MSIRRHWSYFKYVIRHKFFVLLASFRINAPIIQALFHDMSKFKPSEWIPYSNTFYKDDGSRQYKETDDFNSAWNHHQKRNKHHWQYWMLLCDDGRVIAQPMPPKYALEMIADWMGAGKAITGRWGTFTWYHKNKDIIQLHPDTRKDVEAYLFRLREVRLIF